MDQQQSEAPAYQPPAEQANPTAAPVKNRRKILGLWLLIGPSALFVAVIALYAIINFIAGSTVPNPSSSASFGEQSILLSIVNIFTFLLGIVVFLTWLPGIIAGIILLTTQKKS